MHVRPRRRAHQVWQLWLRIPSAVYALVVLIYVCYFIGRWNGTVDPWHEDGSVRKAAGEAGAAALVAVWLATLGQNSDSMRKTRAAAAGLTVR